LFLHLLGGTSTYGNKRSTSRSDLEQKRSGSISLSFFALLDEVKMSRRLSFSPGLDSQDSADVFDGPTPEHELVHNLSLLSSAQEIAEDP
jgi:hypothetical protein